MKSGSIHGRFRQHPTVSDQPSIGGMLWRSFLVSLMLLCAWPAQSARASTDQPQALTVQRNEILLDFPMGLTFHLEASAPSQVQNVYLNYGTHGRSCLTAYSRQAIDTEPGTQVTASWEWDFTQSGSLPPGVEIWWEWEVLLSSGERLLTERMTYTLEDPRFTWMHLENERVSLYWVEGSQTFAAQLMDITQDSLDRLEKEIGVQPLENIRLTVYADADDIQGAILYLSEWIGGLAIPEFNNLIVGIPNGALAWAEELIPHEVAHLVIRMRTFNCLGISLPTWLSEGLSVAAEGDLTQAEKQRLIDRLEDGTLPGLVTLAGGFSADSDEAALSYIQSGVIVFYLLETGGAEKMDALLGVIQGGKNANPALLEVYGLDTAGVDQAWRASLGYGEAPLQQAATATLPPTKIPTRALWTAAVALTPTPTPSPQPTSTHTRLPATATREPATSPDPSPTPSTGEEGGSPLQCLGVTVMSIAAPGLLVVFHRRYRRK